MTLQTTRIPINMLLPALTTNLEEWLIADGSSLLLKDWVLLSNWMGADNWGCLACFMVEICLWTSPSTHIRCSCNYHSVNNLGLCIRGFSTSPSAEACLLSEVSQNPGSSCLHMVSEHQRSLHTWDTCSIDVVPDYLIQSPPGCLLAVDNTASKAHPLTSSWSWKVCSLTTAK